MKVHILTGGGALASRYWRYVIGVIRHHPGWHNSETDLSRKLIADDESPSLDYSKRMRD